MPDTKDLETVGGSLTDSRLEAIRNALADLLQAQDKESVSHLL